MAEKNTDTLMTENSLKVENSTKADNAKKPKPLNAEGHRERMRNIFLANGFENIPTHHLLEMLLYYAIPLKDTREQAVSLLKRFKTLRGVLDADYQDLCGVNGIGPSSALLIKLIYALLRRMNNDTIERSGKFTSIESIGKLFFELTRYEKYEVMYTAAFDNSRRLIATNKIQQNMNGQLNVEFREIINFACRSDAAYIAFGHNHPSGDLIPSLNDINMTMQLRDLLAAIDIVLLEHFVCTEEGYYPIIKNRL